MTTPDRPRAATPTCKRCGRFLRSPLELERGYCSRCSPPPDGKPAEEERFCCGSDPPCPSCPFVVGWGDD
ncbi:MAG: hypothetical protein ACJ8CR_22770 [Roseiflexaceae bacterium]